MCPKTFYRIRIISNSTSNPWTRHQPFSRPTAAHWHAARTWVFLWPIVSGMFLFPVWILKRRFCCPTKEKEKETSRHTGLGEGESLREKLSHGLKPKPACLYRWRWHSPSVWDPHEKKGFSLSESSAGKSPTFTLAVTVITAVSWHNYHRGLELIVIRWYKVIFVTGVFSIKSQSISGGRCLPPSSPDEAWRNTSSKIQIFSIVFSPIVVSLMIKACFDEYSSCGYLVFSNFKSYWNEKKTFGHSTQKWNLSHWKQDKQIMKNTNYENVDHDSRI